MLKIEQKNSNGQKVDLTTEEATITNSTSVMLTSIAQDKNAIGYVSLGSLNNSVKAVCVEGVLPNAENIKNNSYKVSRPFSIVLNQNVTEVTKDFVNYIFSNEGQAVIEKNNYISVETLPYNCSMPSGKIVISGSSSVSPVMEKLIESYKNVNPNAQIELQTSDSTTGVNNVINNLCDIALASRNIKDSELEKGVIAKKIAIDGIAVIVNKENPKSDFTMEEIKNIYTGEIINWDF